MEIIDSDVDDEEQELEDPSQSLVDVLPPIQMSSQDLRAIIDSREYETDLEIEGLVVPFHEVSYEERYLRACELVGVVPSRYFLRNMESTHLDLKHHGLGPKGARAIAIALVSNTCITHLGLEDNWIRDEGLADLVDMLRENYYIQYLDLSNNQLQFRGSEAFCKMLPDNITLLVVKMSVGPEPQKVEDHCSRLWDAKIPIPLCLITHGKEPTKIVVSVFEPTAGNGFKDESAKHFSEALMGNFKVQEFDLSHNAFCESGGEYMGQMLGNNEGLLILDLSWNHIRMKGAVALGAGLKVNTTLTFLNLAFNGFGTEGALALGEALRFNRTLRHLDISNNRINNEGADRLCKGLMVNNTLQVLKLSQNPLTVEGVIALLIAIRKNIASKLVDLDISNVLVNELFLAMLKQTCEILPDLKVSYGGVGGFIAKKKPPRRDPMKMIQNYLDKHKLRMWDFFNNIDKDGSMRIPVSEFRKAMQQQTNIPLDRSQIEELVQRLDNGSGIVDYRGLVDTRKQMMRDHRRHLRREESRQKKEKHKSERVLKTFKSAVEALTPHTSMVISQGPKDQDSETQESRSPHCFSATPLNSWYQAEASKNGHHSAPLVSGRGERIHSTRSEPHVVSHGILTYDPEGNYKSEPNLNSEDQPQSKLDTSTYGSEACSSTFETRKHTTSHKPTLPVMKGKSHPVRSHQKKKSIKPVK